MYPVAGAAAPAFEALPGGRQAPSEPTPANLAAPPEGGYQPSLFRDPLPGPRIMPIPMLTPRPQAGERKAARPPASSGLTSSGLTSGRLTSGRPARRGADSQQSLDFLNAASQGTHALGTEVEAVIYCDAPVALPVHRLMAVAADGSMMAIAVGLFLMIFCLSGGQIVFSQHSALLAAVVIGAVVFLYRLLWCLGNGDTPGMRFAGLRLVNFDGRPPNRDQRLLRLGASVLSLASAGLGLVWALVDEESLTWHDHISKTFPSAG
jgi:uncharacterized RDD family membrane protein YckC